MTIFFLFFMSLYGILGVQFFGELPFHCVKKGTDPEYVPVSQFDRIDLAFTSLLANHLVASESEPAHDQCQSAPGTPLVNLSCSFLSHVSRHLLDFIAIWTANVSIVVSAIAVFRLVDNLMPSHLRLFTDVITNLHHLQTQTVTPVSHFEILSVL